MTLTLDLWMVLTGAICGAVAAYAARGRNKVVKAAVIGAVVAVLIYIARTIF